MITIVSIVWLVCLIISSIILHVFHKKNLAEKAKKYNHAMLCNKKELIIGYALGFFTSIAAVFGFIFDETVIATVMLIFSLILSFVIFIYYSFSAFYDEDEIIYRYWFKRYKTVRFEDVLSISYAGNKLLIQTKSNIIRFSNEQNGCLVELYRHLLSHCVNAIKSKTRIPRVRKLKDSVKEPGDAWFFLGINCFFIILLCIISFYAPEYMGWFISVACFLILNSIVFVISVKRAHSSPIWYYIAKFYIKAEGLNQGVENFQKLVYYMKKGKTIVLMYSGYEYRISKCDVEDSFEISLFQNNIKTSCLLTGNSNEVALYEFSKDVSLKYNFDMFEIVYIL